LRQGFFLVFVFAEKLIASVESFILFTQADGEIATGHTESVEEVRVAAVVVVVHVLHGSNLLWDASQCKDYFDFFLIFIRLTRFPLTPPQFFELGAGAGPKSARGY